MKILISGGAGFIGSWVAEAYISHGHEVIIVDNLSTGKIENIPTGSEFLECDILDKKKLKNVFNEFKPDLLNHHAAQVNVTKSVSDPAYDANNNIIGSLNLFELCKEYEVKKIIFASSGGAIYGDSKSLPVNESNTAAPLSPYGISKLTTELYLQYYKVNYGIEYTSLRYSNVYGERQNTQGESGVIATFCSNIINDKPCTVFGDGSQTRDYVYCKDVALANIEASLKPGGIYNIGTSVSTSVNNIIQILKNLSDSEFKVIYTDERTGEVKHNSLECSLAKKQLSWTPKTDINTGLKNTWEWYLNIFYN